MDSLANKYIGLAISWGKAMGKGNSSLANSIHDSIQDFYAKMEDEQKQGVLNLCADNESDCVRFWAASHLKDIDVQRAKMIYKKLTQSTFPFVALSSRYILRDFEDL